MSTFHRPCHFWVLAGLQSSKFHHWLCSVAIRACEVHQRVVNEGLLVFRKRTNWISSGYRCFTPAAWRFTLIFISVYALVFPIFFFTVSRLTLFSLAIAEKLPSKKPVVKSPLFSIMSCIIFLLKSSPRDFQWLCNLPHALSSATAMNTTGHRNLNYLQAKVGGAVTR